MTLFRKTLFWAHLVVGLTVGLVVALMAGTGAVMAFEHPVVAWAERADGSPPAGVKATDQDKAWTVANLIGAAMAAQPDASPSAFTADADLSRPAAVQVGRDGVVYLNNFTGRVVGTGAPRMRAFFRTVLDLHRWLALNGTGRSWGRNITGAAALGFLMLILSGLWLWVPRRIRWSSIRPVLLPTFGLKGKARDWNWHNVAGFWLATPLLVIVLTGLVIGYPWANALLFRAFGEQPPAPRGEGRPATANGGRRGDGDRRRPDGVGQRRPVNLDGVDDLWAAAEDAAKPGWTTMTMRLGGGGGGDDDGGDAPNAGRSRSQGGVAFALTYGDAANPLNRVTLTFNRRTGELISTQRSADQRPARRARLLIVPIHRGELLGKTGMTIAAASCLGTLLLVYTGFALSWRRLVRPRLKRARRRAGGTTAMRLNPV